MTGDLEFFDTNVLVAATVQEHIHHDACNRRIARIARTGGACAMHSLAEAYTTLTRATRYAMPPSDALRVIEYASKTFKIVSLTSTEYIRTLESAALMGLAGPIVYDALLIACARKIGAKAIYTNNIKHFRQVGPDVASRIHEP